MDLRRLPFREDTAALHLQGRVAARKFVEGQKYRVVAPVTDVKKAPGQNEAIDTQALKGEKVEIFGQQDGWGWGQLEHDKYVGYFFMQDLTEQFPQTATHKVAVPSLHIYPEPDIKIPPQKKLYLNTSMVCTDLVSGKGTDCQFLALDTGGFVIDKHVAEIDEFAEDFVEIAETFLSVPYLWGGKTADGIDCSGLVQVSLQMAGFDGPPRDADMQLDELGEPVAENDLDGLERGDLIFWKGHVGIMTDEMYILHANAHFMQVTKESLCHVAARISFAGNDITGIRRIR